MAYGQMEKLLIKAILEPDFGKELISQGRSAGARYGSDQGEAAALSELLANDGAGLAAVLSVIDTAIDARLSLGLFGRLPHELGGGDPKQHQPAGHVAPMSAHTG
ncbi:MULTISPECIES: hypothetical protein [Bradyrhizobium]|jgi:hypothetical protein|uniref:Uncharacterized protein n=1 Tax=Bradyrhizobium elkanii TaxID=29448 RepID=A0A8I1Y7T2_BRAEL|nr:MULTISPECIES: hypothetical protein [Bradyrhizobium]MBP1293579.1 hypothetical protein [Bradyrhizobium elkanii]MCP1925837.1 hypothetical protein [Bradyrhizobium elkanii]MCS3451471.1 hypothetical protein [Bradyrhizobium elkanii]MCS3476671.1 hypothetical protein [Bradyrhizobium elkanii]MCS3566504.1 hypothetical protein [Bradyrhizobium elkanii]